MEKIINIYKQAMQPQLPKKEQCTNFRNEILHPDDMVKWKYHFLSLINKEFYAESKKFVLDDTNRDKISLCFDWCVGNVDVTLNKGLTLMGEVGTGKSCILKACKKFVEFIYKDIQSIYILADNIARLYTNSDEDICKLNQLFTVQLLFIDDIGYEPLKVYDHSPIAEVIRERYDKKRITCVTTNRNSEGLINRYEKSFEDKLYEMTYYVNFSGDSKR